MGTRADFYIGKGKDAEWLGSVAWDGYAFEEAENDPIITPKTAEDFKKAVTTEIKGRDDGTLPEHGWPWPWESSYLTDYVYYFEDGKVYASTGQEKKSINWPNMADKQNVNLGKRSGIIIIG